MCRWRVVVYIIYTPHTYIYTYIHMYIPVLRVHMLCIHAICCVYDMCVIYLMYMRSVCMLYVYPGCNVRICLFNTCYACYMCICVIYVTYVYVICVQYMCVCGLCIQCGGIL